MSGALKSGLLFALVGLIGIVAFSFVFTALIPAGGPIICGPVIAMLVGAAAGYFGVRWSAGAAGVGTGVLAGAVAGAGAMLGAMLFVFASISFLRATMGEGFDQLLLDQMRRQQPGIEIPPGSMSMLVGFSALLAGCCLGLIYLLFSLALGALGGWLALRQRGRQLAPATSTPIEPPTLGPPPLDPPG